MNTLDHAMSVKNIDQPWVNSNTRHASQEFAVQKCMQTIQVLLIARLNDMANRSGNLGIVKRLNPQNLSARTLWDQRH
jgi:hypothetical protein